MTQPYRDRVVIGVDGSPGSRRAVRFGVAEARRRGTGVTLLHALTEPTTFGVGVTSQELGAMVQQAEEALAREAADLREANPGLDVQVFAGIGSPAALLIDSSRSADLLVVGCRGLGGFSELLLGSVSAQVAGHAYAPVIVVRPRDHDTSPRPDAPIVAGVDGSAPSRAALAFAFQTAESRGQDLVAMHCWAPTAGLLEDYSEEDLAADEAAAAAMLSEAVAAERRRHPGVRVEERSLRHGYAESALIEASAEAGLIVVGSRGRGGFAGLVLGSVSQALLHHGHCPVAVVHTAPDA